MTQTQRPASDPLPITMKTKQQQKRERLPRLQEQRCRGQPGRQSPETERSERCAKASPLSLRPSALAARPVVALQTEIQASPRRSRRERPRAHQERLPGAHCLQRRSLCARARPQPASQAAARVTRTLDTLDRAQRMRSQAALALRRRRKSTRALAAASRDSESASGPWHWITRRVEAALITLDRAVWRTLA
jgi:hypothetical protein